MLTFVNLKIYIFKMNNRIAEILKSEGLTNSQFANLIGVQASAITHILNGRNEPSLKVVKSILDNFRAINPDWLVSGIGEMYRKSPEPTENKEVKTQKTIMHPVQQSLFPEYPIPTPEYGKENELTAETDLSSNSTEPIVQNSVPNANQYTQQTKQSPIANSPQSFATHAQPIDQSVSSANTQPNNIPLNTPVNQPTYDNVTNTKNEERPASNPVPPRIVKKIIVFYSDGTYEEYGAHLNIN